MIDALIFDCDGTLSHSMPLHYRAWRQVLDPLGVEFTEQTFYDLAGMPGHKVMGQVSGDRFSGRQLDELIETRESAFHELLDELEPVPLVIDIARQHRGELKMAVASGGLRASVERQLVVLGIGEWFEAVVTAEDTELHKPEPDVFLEAARRLDVAAEACCVYEDSDLGIEAAKRAGMQWVDVRPMYPS